MIITTEKLCTFLNTGVFTS